MVTEATTLSKTELEFQLSELRREYLSCRFEQATEKGRRHRIREVRRSIARLLTAQHRQQKPDV